MLLKTTTPSEEDYKSFTRPAVFDSVRRMLSFYGLESATEIYYNGRNESAPLLGSRASDQIRANLYTDGVFRNKIFVVAEDEDSAFNTGFSNQRREITERPVWMNTDPKPMMIYPSFGGRQITVSIIAYFNSSKSADQFRRRINRAQDAQVVSMNFSATVHMPLNNTILAMMSNVHKLLVKNADPDTPEDFGDWFKKYSRVPFMHISNAAGKNPRLAVPMRLDEIGLYFKEPTVKKTRNAAVFGTYEVECSYMFYFPEFVGWELEYPLNIYQDEVNQEWIGRPDVQFKRKFNVRVNPEYSFGKALSDTRGSQAPFYLKLPEHDPWVMPHGDWIQPILQARLTVKDVEEQQFSSIFSIPGFKWNERVKAYILRRREVAFNQFQTPFLITVWSEDLQVDPARLVMDELGGITMTGVPNMRNKYRVVVTFDQAVRDYSENFWDDLRLNRDDEDMLPGMFPGFDWANLPRPWADYPTVIRKGIDKGRGLPGEMWNTYMMELGLNAYLLIEDTRNDMGHKPARG